MVEKENATMDIDLLNAYGNSLASARAELKKAVEEIRGKLQGRHAGLEAEAKVLVSQDYAHVQVLLEDYIGLVETITEMVVEAGWLHIALGKFRRKFKAYAWIPREELLQAIFLGIRTKAVPFWDPEAGPLQQRVVLVGVEKAREFAGAGGDGGAVSVPRRVAEGDNGFNRPTLYSPDLWVFDHGDGMNHEDVVIELLDAKRHTEGDKDNE
jgi:hypothetical protein